MKGRMLHDAGDGEQKASTNSQLIYSSKSSNGNELEHTEVGCYHPAPNRTRSPRGALWTINPLPEPKTQREHFRSTGKASVTVHLHLPLPPTWQEGLRLGWQPTPPSPVPYPPPPRTEINKYADRSSGQTPALLSAAWGGAAWPRSSSRTASRRRITGARNKSNQAWTQYGPLCAHSSSYSCSHVSTLRNTWEVRITSGCCEVLHYGSDCVA